MSRKRTPKTGSVAAPLSGNARCSWCGELVSGSTHECAVKRVTVGWEELMDLVKGAEGRGWSQDQVDYLTSCMGITWAKGYAKGAREALASVRGAT